MRDILRIMEGETLPADFIQDGNEYQFECEFGCGIIGGDFSKRYCYIYEFSVSVGSAGNGRRMLKWLRRYFDFVVVVDPGPNNEASWLFWAAMYKEGLVQEIIDEEQLPLSHQIV